MSTVDETINNFVQCAERFHGVREGTTQHSIIIALYNSNRPRGEYEMTMQDPWCAAFVGAVSGSLGLERIIPVSASCERMQQKLLEYGAKVVSVPQSGDIAFFDWNEDGKYYEHVGIVTRVKDGTVTTIEGNKNDMVAYRQFSNLNVIFYRPNWSGEIQSTETIQWETYREYYQELTWDEKSEIKTFPTLSLGSMGIYVKILQDFIGLDADGDFGDETSESLIAYQKSKQLEPDGICGRQTWSSFFA